MKTGLIFVLALLFQTSVASAQKIEDLFPGQIAELSQTWHDKRVCLVVEGHFLEKAVRDDDSRAIIRSHAFKGWVACGKSTKFALNFIPAKTRWVDGKYPFSYWNGRIAYDGENWIVAKSAIAGDPESPLLNKWWEINLSSQRPLELGTAGRNLLTFEYLLPWKIAMRFPPEVADIQKIMVMSDTKLSTNGDDVIIENRNVCTATTLNLDLSEGIRLKSFTIENNLCVKETEGPSTDETIFSEWQKMGTLQLPAKISRIIINDGKFMASNEISITKFAIASEAELDAVIQKARSDYEESKTASGN